MRSIRSSRLGECLRLESRRLQENELTDLELAELDDFVFLGWAAAKRRLTHSSKHDIEFHNRVRDAVA